MHRRESKLSDCVRGLHKMKLVAAKRKAQEYENKEKPHAGRRVWRLLRISALNPVIITYLHRKRPRCAIGKNNARGHFILCKPSLHNYKRASLGPSETKALCSSHHGTWKPKRPFYCPHGNRSAPISDLTKGQLFLGMHAHARWAFKWDGVVEWMVGKGKGQGGGIGRPHHQNEDGARKHQPRVRPTGHA